jgi:ribosomal protein L22
MIIILKRAASSSSPLSSTSTLWNRLTNTLGQGLWRRRQTPASKEPANQLPATKTLSSSPAVACNPKRPLGQSIWMQTGFFRGSPQKVGLLCRQITQLRLSQALEQMRLSPKKAARQVCVLLKSCENKLAQHGLKSEDIGEFYVRQAQTGRGTLIPELDIKARGRFGLIEHPHTMLRVEVARWSAVGDLRATLRRQLTAAHTTPLREHRRQCQPSPQHRLPYNQLAGH